VAGGRGGEVWALDAGRKLLLKVGQQWINEIPLPPDASSPRSLAVADDGVWFSDDAHLVGFRRPGGRIEMFEVPGLDRPGLLQLPNVLGVLIRAAGSKNVARLRPPPPISQSSGCPVAPLERAHNASPLTALKIDIKP